MFNWVLMHVTLPNTMHRLICLLRDSSTYQPTNDQVEIGGYPIVNVYANLHLKRTRFFVMMYHVNDGLINRPNAFYAPHYPINPRLLKFGVSWNFYD